MSRLTWMAGLLLVAAAAVNAKAEDSEAGKDFSTFIGEGTYSPSPGCKTLEAIEAGKQEPNISNYPLTLSNEGTRTWEGGCDVQSGSESNPGQFDAKMKCFEGDQEFEESTTFTRVDEDHVEIKTDKDKLVYEKCKGLKGQDNDD